MSISKDGRTLVLDQERGTFTVTEDATGEVLTVVEFDIFTEDAPAQVVVDEDTGSLTILDEDGNELMTVTEAEGEAAQAELEEEYGDVFESEALPLPAVAYSPDGAEWFTVSTDGLDVAWAQGMAVGRDSVVIVGESTAAYYEGATLLGSNGDVAVEFSTSTPATTVVSGEGFSAPPVHMWVGTTR